MVLERWLRIELRHLFALEAVVEEGSFSAAGDRLGYVQSAVSHQIASLEGIVGHRLFERTRGTKPVALTAKGTLLYAHAKTILSRVRAAEADLDGELELDLLHVGSFQAISSRVVPRVLELLGETVRVSLHEQMTEIGLLDRLGRGELDVVFAEDPLPAGPYRREVLFEDPYVVLAAAGSDVALAGDPLTLRELTDLPLVGHSGERPRLERHLEARSLRANYLVRSDLNSTVQALVRAGVAYAVVPRFSVDESDPDVVVLPLEPVDAVEPRVIVCAWNADREVERPVAAFVDAAQEACADLGLAAA